MTKRIMIVEDNMIVRMDLEDSLQDAGHEIVAKTAYGNIALENAIAIPMDLILLDIGLKGEIDGLEAIQNIKADPSIPSIPFIILSGNSDLKTHQRIKTLNPYAVIVKPINIDNLISLIGSMEN